MSEILFLAHRIPYPPDKGDKIRSCHLLRALAAEHTVHLGTFIDDEADWAHVDAVRQLCGGETCIRPLNPGMARLRSVRGLLTGEPLTLAYYRDHALRAWVEDVAVRRPLRGVFAFSSSMAQYAADIPLAAGAPRVLDLCDVDSDKWRQYAATHPLPMNLVYEREARRLAVAEASYVRQFDASLVISRAEAEILTRVAAGGANQIMVVANGVDTEYFDPALQFDNPFDPSTRPMVFTGAMDYHANADAVRWFAREVLPSVRSEVPNALFVIVGSNPSPDVLTLSRDPGVVVTGRVPDVRPYLAHAAVVVAPLRISRGVQNKVLEALAMARPIVATPNALQGIPEADAAGIRIAEGAVDVRAVTVAALSAPGQGLPGRQFVRERYGWRAHLRPMLDLFQRGTPGQCVHTCGPAVAA